jgi:aminopeptidase N
MRSFVETTHGRLPSDLHPLACVILPARPRRDWGNACWKSFAQAFAGTMPYSKSIGFNANTNDPEKIDFTSYVVAHEMAHQYWAHQVVGADQQGGTLTSETLAQYSALMVMRKLYGPDQIRRFLEYELDNYLSGRKGEATEELPLVRVENQGYIHYRKGAVIMYLLQEQLG